MKYFLLILLSCSFIPLQAQGQDDADSKLKKKINEKRKKQAEEEKRKKERNAVLFSELRLGMLSSDLEIRLASLESIMAMKDVDKGGLIIKSLEDNSSRIRIRVLDYFIQEKTNTHLDALSHVLGDGNVKVRKKIAETVLAYSNGKFNTYSMIENLLEDKQTAIRKTVIEGIKKFSKEHFKKRDLFDAMRNAYFDSDLKLRMLAYSYIDRFSIDFTHDYLESALNDSQIKIRQQVLEIVGKMGSKKARQLIVNSLNDTYNPIRMRCVEFLGNKLDDDLVRIFDNHILGEKNYKIRIKILETIATRPTPKVVVVISRYLTDPVLNVRRKAVGLLEDIRKKND